MKHQRRHLVDDMFCIELLVLVNAKHKAHFGQMKRVVLLTCPPKLPSF